MLRCRSGGAVQSKEYGPCNVALPHARRRDRAPLGQWTYHLRIGLDRTKYVARYLLQALLPDRPAWGRCDPSRLTLIAGQKRPQMRPLRVTRSDEWMMKNWRPSTNI